MSDTISTLKCLRIHRGKPCGYTWLPRKIGRPVRCPSCKSPYWDKPPGDK